MRCASMIAARAVVLLPLADGEVSNACGVTGVCGAGARVLALALAVGETMVAPARARPFGERVATVDGARRVGVIPLCGATRRVGDMPFSAARRVGTRRSGARRTVGAWAWAVGRRRFVLRAGENVVGG